MRTEAIIGVVSLATGLFGFGIPLLCTEGLSDEQIRYGVAGFLVTMIGGAALIYVSRFNTEEDPAFAV